MYLERVIVDYLSPDGGLTSYRVWTESKGGLFLSYPPDFTIDDPTSMDVGIYRIRDASRHQIDEARGHCDCFKKSEKGNAFSFCTSYSHLGSKDNGGHFYNLILAPGWEISSIKAEEWGKERPKEERSVRIFWDAQNEIQGVELAWEYAPEIYSFALYGIARKTARESGRVPPVDEEYSESVCPLKSVNQLFVSNREDSIAEGAKETVKEINLGFIKLDPAWFITRIALRLARRGQKHSKAAQSNSVSASPPFHIQSYIKFLQELQQDSHPMIQKQAIDLLAKLER